MSKDEMILGYTRPKVVHAYLLLSPCYMVQNYIYDAMNLVTRQLTGSEPYKKKLIMDL